MPSPPMTRDRITQFRAPITLTTMLEMVRIMVPFRNFLVLLFAGVCSCCAMPSILYLVSETGVRILAAPVLGIHCNRIILSYFFLL